MEKITDKDIKIQEERQVKKWGFIKFPVSSRNGYWAVNEIDTKEIAERPV